MRPSFFQRFGPQLTLFLLLFGAAASGFHFYSHTFRGLGPQALDSAQLARNIFRGAGFSSDILPASALTPGTMPQTATGAAGRPFNPELGQGPLFPLLLGAVFAVAGERDGVVAGFSLSLFLGSTALLFGLTRRLTRSAPLATVTALAFLVSFPVLGLAVSGQPQALSSFLLLATLFALTPRNALATRIENKSAPKELESDDFTESKHDNPPLASPDVAPNLFFAGILAALCYLSDPLVCLTLAPLIWVWRRGFGGWNPGAARAFGTGFLILALPWWIRNARLTGAPFFSTLWLGPGAASGWRGLTGNFGQSIGGLIRGAASIPHFLLAPFLLVSPWMRPLSPAHSEARAAIFAGFGWTILGLAALGQRDLALLMPLAPLLTLLGVMTFRQIVGDAFNYGLQNGADMGFGARLWLLILTICGLRQLRAEWLARRAYQTQIEAQTGEAALDSGALPRARLHLARGFAALLLLLSLPLLSLRSQPSRAGARGVLAPLSQVVAPARAIATDAPQALAWYSDRRVTALPGDAKSWLSAPPPLVGAVYLSGQNGGISTAIPAQWREIAARGLDLPGFALLTRSGAPDLIYRRKPLLEEAQAALQTNTRNGAAWLALGNALVQKGDFTRALPAFQSATRLLPRSAASFYGAGLCYAALKNQTAARAQFGRALSFEPRRIATLLELAKIEQTRNDKGAAIALYERVLADVPDHRVALNNLAQLHADQGKNLFRALELARRAAAQNPRNGAILDTLGQVCTRLNYRQEAVAYFKRAALLSPQDSGIAARLKRAQVLAGAR